MTVMGFDNFDIGIIAHDFGRLLKQLQHDVDAHAKVGGEHNGDLCAGIANRLFSGLIKTGRANHHPFAMLSAKVQMMQRPFRTGEIDKNIKIIRDRLKTGLHPNTDIARARKLACVAANQRRAFTLQRRADGYPFHLQRRLNQLPPHAATRSRDSYTNLCIMHINTLYV